MRISTKSAFSNTNLVNLKNQDWLDKQRIAGRLAAKALSTLKEQVQNRTSKTVLELNNMAEELIAEGGGIPTFKNYKGFPAGVCVSINKQLVHGIPTDYTLQDGDVISFDLGVTYEKAIADTALTCIYGQPKSARHVDLVKATEEALLRGIRAIKVDKRLGAIGNAIYKYSRDVGFNPVINYGGHGLDWNTPHASPFVANKGDPNDGIRIKPGLAIAIEPMLVIGNSDTYVSGDGWTVMTHDIGAHFEHSVFVHEDKVEIITWREDCEYPREISFA